MHLTSPEGKARVCGIIFSPFVNDVMIERQSYWLRRLKGLYKDKVFTHE